MNEWFDYFEHPQLCVAIYITVCVCVFMFSFAIFTDIANDVLISN